MFRSLARTVVLVHDLDAALAFYRDVLGFAVLHDATVGGYRYLHVGPQDAGDAGVWLMPAVTDEARAAVGRQTAGAPLMVLYTDDLDAVHARLAAAGVEVWARRDDDESRSLHFRDVAGNAVIAAQLAG
jgi:predicted enzyme related to lactoylglutathione lyase